MMMIMMMMMTMMIIIIKRNLIILQSILNKYFVKHTKEHIMFYIKTNSSRHKLFLQILCIRATRTTNDKVRQTAPQKHCKRDSWTVLKAMAKRFQASLTHTHTEPCYNKWSWWVELVCRLRFGSKWTEWQQGHQQHWSANSSRGGWSQGQFKGLRMFPKVLKYL